MPHDQHEAPDPLEALEQEHDERRRAAEKRGERHMWWYLAYFLFGIHLVALVMIYAVTHTK